MTSITALTEVTDPADNDWLYLWDASNPSNPDRKMSPSRLRPAGSKISSYARFASTITVPALAAGIEADASIAVVGAAVGDHVQFNLNAAPPANLAILACWAEADVVKVRFRNLHASTGYAGAALACTALVTRSV